jgi:hypothetical protein
VAAVAAASLGLPQQELAELVAVETLVQVVAITQALPGR